MVKIFVVGNTSRVQSKTGRVAVTMKLLMRTFLRPGIILTVVLAFGFLRIPNATTVKVGDSTEQSLLAQAQQLVSSQSSSACDTIVWVFSETSAELGDSDSPVMIFRSLDTLKNVTWVKFGTQCSIVLYPYSLPEKVVEQAGDRNWLRHIPGGIFRSFHFVAERAKAVQHFCWHCPFVRRLHNVLLFSRSDSNEFGQILTPNRFNGDPDFLHVGRIMKSQIMLEHPQALKHGPFWNKWTDLNGSSLFIGALPIPDSRQLANSSSKAFNPVAIQLQETADFLNAELQMKFIPLTKRFGERLPNGSWDGFIGAIMDDSVQLTTAMFPIVEQSQVVLFSKPFLFSWTTFLTPLPQMRTKTFAFLAEPFDRFVWAGILACSMLLPLVLLGLQSGHQRTLVRSTGLMLKCVENFAGFAQLLLEQSLPESCPTAMRKFRAVRWLLLGFWLLASIVLCNLYKSVVVSYLVRPELEQPPLTFSELETTNFHINIIMLKSLSSHFMPWLDAYNRSYTDFDVNIKGVCFPAKIGFTNGE